MTVPLLFVFLARAVDGITAGDISVANAYLSDISEEKDLKKNYGQMASSANIGFILGPILAGLLGATALVEITYNCSSSLFTCSFIFIAFGLPESNKKAKNFKQTGKSDIEKVGNINKRPGFIFLMRQPDVAMMLVLYFLIYLGFNFFYIAFPLYANEI